MSDNNTRNNFDSFHHETNSVDRHEDEPNAHRTHHEHDLNHDGEDSLPRKEKKIAMTYRLAPTTAAAFLAAFVLLSLSMPARAADNLSAERTGFKAENYSESFCRYDQAFVYQNDQSIDQTDSIVDKDSANYRTDRYFVSPSDNIDNPSFIDKNDRYFGDANRNFDGTSFIDKNDRYFGDANRDFDSTAVRDFFTTFDGSDAFN